MLVLSRRVGEQVLFPHLGIKVEVCQAGTNRVRLGIAAPKDVTVARPETLGPEDLEAFAERTLRTKTERHELKNRLNTLGLALKLFQRQQELGQEEAAAKTLDMVFTEMGKLDSFASGTGQPQGEAPSNREVRLLVVEDEDNERELLASLLRSHGFAVDSVPDGAKAIESLEGGMKPDLVLLDMNMPNRNGRETLEAIRSDSRFEGIKVVAVTGADRTADADEFDAWFPKPLDAEQLIRTVRRGIGSAAKAAGKV
ncbi:response regulator [Stratiformator vulcanicus]|uniref:Translational regulator CsrA n=1 Tax=Stratiformator vulcanicus TaxID=2527980 RepID=A0A517QVR7_9PLAN|nr:DNA-binding response regulator MtrA [Stratiformator vulcanicus]